MKTYNQILDYLAYFVAQHQILQSFGYGSEKELNTFMQNNTLAPMLYASIENIIVANNEIAYFITLTCIDSRGKDQDNLRDIQSDTAQILIDLRSWLINNFEANGIYTLNTEAVRLSPVINITNDWYSGWRTVLKASTVLIESDCYVPMFPIID